MEYLKMLLKNNNPIKNTGIKYFIRMNEKGIDAFCLKKHKKIKNKPIQFTIERVNGSVRDNLAKLKRITKCYAKTIERRINFFNLLFYRKVINVYHLVIPENF